MIIKVRILFRSTVVVEPDPIEMNGNGDQDIPVTYTDFRGQEHQCELGVHLGTNLIRIRLEDRTTGKTQRWEGDARSSKTWYRLKQDRQPADQHWSAWVNLEEQS